MAARRDRRKPAGAGLTIGTAIAAKAAPTVTRFSSRIADPCRAPSLYKNLRYDPIKDLRPITLVARAPAILAVNPKIPVANLREFIEFAKEQRDPVLFASAGNGTFPHLTGLLFRATRKRPPSRRCNLGVAVRQLRRCSAAMRTSLHLPYRRSCLR